MMNNFAVAGMALCMFGVLAVLATGLFVMLRGDDVTGVKSNKLMWKRIYLQAAALAFFALVLMLAKK